jgi:hypothetical protein
MKTENLQKKYTVDHVKKKTPDTVLFGRCAPCVYGCGNSLINARQRCLNIGGGFKTKVNDAIVMISRDSIKNDIIAGRKYPEIL